MVRQLHCDHSTLTTDSASEHELIGSRSGVKNADENELRSIATDPDDIHMYNVADFSFLFDIVDSLTDNLCNSVKGPGERVFISGNRKLDHKEAADLTNKY